MSMSGGLHVCLLLSSCMCGYFSGLIRVYIFGTSVFIFVSLLKVSLHTSAAHIWALLASQLSSMQVCLYLCLLGRILPDRKINLNKKSLVNPRSTSNQSSKPCTVLQYPSDKKSMCLYLCLFGHIVSHGKITRYFSHF